MSNNHLNKPKKLTKAERIKKFNLQKRATHIVMATQVSLLNELMRDTQGAIAVEKYCHLYFSRDARLDIGGLRALHEKLKCAINSGDNCLRENGISDQQYLFDDYLIENFSEDYLYHELNSCYLSGYHPEW